MRKSILLSTAASILLASTAVAQDGTDTCTAPTAIGEGTFAFDTSTMAGSGELAEGACGTLDFNQDMFWVYTATVAGDLTIDTDGTGFDTQLAVYSGIDCGATCVAQNDDINFPSNPASSLTINGINIGDTFVVQVGGYNAENGPGGLNVTVNSPAVPPANDDCAGATAIGGAGAFAYDPTIAGDSGFAGDGACAQDSQMQDVFFAWTASADGDYTFETEDHNLSYDSRMAIYSGDCMTAACLGSDDDSGAGFGSLISLTGVLSGETYLIQVGTYSATTTLAPNVLTVTQAPDGSSCDLGLPIAGAGAFAYDTTGHVTTGFSEGACTSVNQDEFFVWTADAAGDWSIDTFLTTYDTKLAIFAGSDCTATCAGSNDDTGGVQSQVILTGVGIGDTFLIQVGGYSVNEGAGTLTIAPTVDPCDVSNEDVYEENDTCATAMAMAVGTYTGLYATDADADWYAISIPAGEILSLTATNVTGDVDFNVLESDCLTVIGAAEGSFTLNNTGAVALDVVIEAANDSIGGGPCAIYDLDIAIAPDPCDPGNDDALEDNDDCASATAMTDGTTTGLFVSKTDKDFYAFCVANGATVNIDMLFTSANGDMDGFLRAADSLECGNGNGSDELADGFSGSDNENITWTNNTGADLDVILEVNLWDNAGNPDCNTYDLVITGAGNCNGYLGSMYCTAEINTTGVVSSIFGTGDIVAANNAFGLLATDLPNGEFGYFIGSFGQAQVNMPGGSSGNLCVGGGLAIARFLPTLGTIAGGQLAGSVDLTDVPLPPTMSGMILGGDTFNFQLWHREGGPLSGMSNFTPGLEVTFQ